MRKIPTQILAAALTFVLGGCLPTVAERAERTVALPGRWQSAKSSHQLSVTGGWLAEFGSDQLLALVREGLTANHDLRIAAARIDQAAGLARAAGADRLPSLTLEAGYDEREQSDEEAGEILIDRSRRYHLGSRLSWELDLWGRLADRHRAAEAQARADELDYQAARLSLAGRIAALWFDAIEAELQLAHARQTLANYQEVVDSVRGRYLLGVGNGLDLHLALADVALARDQLVRRESERRNLVSGLQVLLGRYPDGCMALPADLPRLDTPIPAGLPAELLARRPDIRAAGERLAAGNLKIAGAGKAFLPQFSLTGELGVSSGSLRRLVDGDRLLWNLLFDLGQPLYDGGRLRAELAVAEAEADEAALLYSQTVLTALREVESGLDQAPRLADSETALGQALAEAEIATALAEADYLSGTADIITLLSARRRQIEARAGLISATHQRLRNRITLHVALAGDFVITSIPL